MHPAAGKLHFLLSLSFSHLKTRENEIAGGDIGCYGMLLRNCYRATELRMAELRRWSYGDGAPRLVFRDFKMILHF